MVIVSWKLQNLTWRRWIVTTRYFLCCWWTLIISEVIPEQAKNSRRRLASRSISGSWVFPLGWMEEVLSSPGQSARNAQLYLLRFNPDIATPGHKMSSPGEEGRKEYKYDGNTQMRKKNAFSIVWFFFITFSLCD